MSDTLSIDPSNRRGSLKMRNVLRDQETTCVRHRSDAFVDKRLSLLPDPIDDPASEAAVKFPNVCRTPCLAQFALRQAATAMAVLLVSEHAQGFIALI